MVADQDEFETLIETLDILSDPETIADVTEAEADLVAGNLVDLG